MEERIARLRRVAEVELVAEIGRVLGQDAVAEQPEDRRVLPLQAELELGLELVELVDMRHAGQSSLRADSTPGLARDDEAGIELGERLEGETALVEPRMRHVEARLVDGLVAVEEEVEVDRPRPEPAAPSRRGRGALDLEQALEQLPAAGARSRRATAPFRNGR